MLLKMRMERPALELGTDQNSREKLGIDQGISKLIFFQMLRKNISQLFDP